MLFFTTLSQLVLAFAFPYFVLTLILGVRVSRRYGGRLGAQELVDDYEVDLNESSPHHLYVMVPCLNEERVIGATVNRLAIDPQCRIVVIDDGSDDATAAEAQRAAAEIGASDRVMVLSRRLPNARQGKGPALNAGFAVLVDDVHRRGLDANSVVVVVMDADGRLSNGGTRTPLSRFDDPRVGAVQLTVRIRNRDKLITQFQDVEFWMISAMSQFARSLSGTVSLGGNGQFTRLSALLSLTGDPWSDSLTEDLDLGLRLIAAGWRVTTTSRAYVDQQGVVSYRTLVRQRTRWYQGHMLCISRLPELWRSNDVGQAALIEVTSYLLVPWVIVLPWSILQQWILFQVIFGSGRGIYAGDLGSPGWKLAYGVLWYLLSFLPNVAIGWTYSRRTRAVSLAHALLLGHLMILWNYVGYLATWKALVRMLRKRNGWDKTARSIETTDGTTVVPDEEVLALDEGVLAFASAGPQRVESNHQTIPAVRALPQFHDDLSGSTSGTKGLEFSNGDPNIATAVAGWQPESAPAPTSSVTDTTSLLNGAGTSWRRDDGDPTGGRERRLPDRAEPPVSDGSETLRANGAASIAGASRPVLALTTEAAMAATRLSEAAQWAAEVISEAHDEAAAIVDRAEAEAAARRSEAEQLFEQAQRLFAAASSESIEILHRARARAQELTDLLEARQRVVQLGETVAGLPAMSKTSSGSSGDVDN